MDTLFQSQDIGSSQINTSQITQLKKGIMEVESVSQITRRQETNESYLNLITTIADKGNTNLQINEVDLIKDLVFCLQGIEGQYINYDQIQDCFMVKKDIALSIPSRKLINVLCECGWLFKKIQQFQQLTNQSLVIQALQTANKEELNEYYRLIAYFEGLIQIQDGIQQLTLRKMYMWLKQPMHYLTQINLVISTINSNSNMGSTSALILSTLHQYSKHGCPTTSELFRRVFQQTCIPLVRFINQWVFDGTLEDIAGEFFVAREESKQPIRDSGELWKREFKLHQDKIPNLMKFEDAHRIYDTGRVVNWLRKQCHCKKWKLQQDLVTIDMLQTPSFSEWVLRANQTTNQELVSLVFDQFKFNVHLQAIKRFLLLGQGEFIHTLMEILQEELTKQAIYVQKHQLLGFLETAIRSSNIQNLPQEVALRLNIKLLEPSKDDSGWEVFCLDYHIDEPLNTIFNGRVMLFYYRIFNFFWRVKRVEYTLSQCWVSHLKFRAIPSKMTQLKKTIQLSQSMMNEMQHFIKNFYSYIMLEAVESTWKKLIDELEKIKDLDSLIKIHEHFQSEVLERAFLTQKTETIQKSLLKIFELIFRFKSLQEDLLAKAKDMIETQRSDERDQKLRVLLDQRSMQIERNKVQFKGSDSMRLLLDLRKAYREQMFELLEKLRKEDRLKFLHFKLDFNGYYQGIIEGISNVSIDKFVQMYLPILDQSARVQSQKQISHSSSASKQQQQQQQQQQQPTQSQTSIQPSSQRANTFVSQQEQMRQVKDGLKMLEEQRKQFLLKPKEKVATPQLPPKPIISVTPTSIPNNKAFLTAYEQQKNNENLDDSSDEEIQFYKKDDNDNDDDESLI